MILSNSDNGILKILRFTNNLTEEEIVLEECGSILELLKGHYVTLPRQYFQDMRFYLHSLYGNHSEIVDETFDSNVDEHIAQLCCLARGNGNYTEMFVKMAGGAEALIGNGVATMFSESDFDEEEDEEMYKEMYEKSQKELEDLKLSKDKEIGELKSKVNTLDSEVKSYKDIFEDFDDLEEDDLNSIADALESLNTTQYADLVFALLGKNAGEEGTDIKDLKILRIYMKSNGRMVN